MPRILLVLLCSLGTLHAVASAASVSTPSSAPPPRRLTLADLESHPPDGRGDFTQLLEYMESVARLVETNQLKNGRGFFPGRPSSCVPSRATTIEWLASGTTLACGRRQRYPRRGSRAAQCVESTSRHARRVRLASRSARRESPPPKTRICRCSLPPPVFKTCSRSRPCPLRGSARQESLRDAKDRRCRPSDPPR